MKKDEKWVLLENIKLHDINPLFCGEERCPPNLGPDFISPNYYLIHYVISGTGIYYTPSENFKVTGGQIFVIYPNETVKYTADDRDPWHYYWVAFEASLDLSNILNSYVFTAPEIYQVFHAIVNSPNYISKSPNFYICGKIFEMISLLDKQLYSEKNNTHQYVRMTLNFIETHYQHDLRVDMLAESLNLDRAYFSRIFKKFTAKTPQQYIVDFRLDKAAEMLARQDLAPGEVARQVGYKDVTNFSRMFSRRFGMPPTMYRKKVRDK